MLLDKKRHLEDRLKTKKSRMKKKKALLTELDAMIGSEVDDGKKENLREERSNLMGRIDDLQQLMDEIEAEIKKH